MDGGPREIVIDLEVISGLHLKSAPAQHQDQGNPNAQPTDAAKKPLPNGIFLRRRRPGSSGKRFAGTVATRDPDRSGRQAEEKGRN